MTASDKTTYQQTCQSTAAYCPSRLPGNRRGRQWAWWPGRCRTPRAQSKGRRWAGRPRRWGKWPAISGWPGRENKGTIFHTQTHTNRGCFSIFSLSEYANCLAVIRYSPLFLIHSVLSTVLCSNDTVVIQQTVQLWNCIYLLY